ncbi:hypothetical protein UCREL1_11163 [Eutypa lata UCREL1]|uniref:Uncharacterized protein n=1 Tax=Eutypa lata (strain UCR-EL1) TaxID=1287681 RepID=M7T5H7_EUTLA|nr:hypothetical protein UCREL1_11163 [Eutypa lata UCREL1]
MGLRQDALISYLRRGEYPTLTRWEGLQDALFAGSKAEITAAITQVLRSPQVKGAKDFISAVSSDTFQVDPTHDALAFYDTDTLERKYPKVADAMNPSRASGLQNIGTVPHPYTLQTVNALRESIDISWVRRETKRDEWLRKLFKDLLGTGVGGTPRLIKFKEAVAGEHATAHSVWMTAERESVPQDLDWWFGFAIPHNATDDGKSETPVPGPERRPKPQHDPNDGPIPKEDDLVQEPALLQKARDIIKSKADEDVRIRNTVEAWNLADAEAWRFARAYMARSRVERLKWEEEESKYAGGAGIDKENGPRSGWTRWADTDEEE